MIDNIKMFVLVLLISSVSNVYGQFIIQKELSLDNLSKSWSEYQQDTKYNLTNLSLSAIILFIKILASEKAHDISLYTESEIRQKRQKSPIRERH